MAPPGLNERERRVLEAVIQTYVETAQPAGSRSLAHKFGLGVSPATIRNTMSDLEEKGYLFHPHASAGRVPTDVAYRVYVDSLIAFRPLGATERRRSRVASASAASPGAAPRSRSFCARRAIPSRAIPGLESSRRGSPDCSSCCCSWSSISSSPSSTSSRVGGPWAVFEESCGSPRVPRESE